MRVLVVAASAVVRAGLAAVLERAETLIVVGMEPADAAVASLVATYDVDVLLWAPADDRAEAALGAPLPATPAVVARAPRRDAAWAERVLAAGVRAVLEPDPSPEEITAAIEAAARGLVVLAPALAATLLARRDIAAGSVPRHDQSDAAARLTPRELEILGWLAQGLANKHVASRLGLSEHTVKTHVAHLFEKLGVGTRAEAVARAVRLGVLAL
ncbi:MAG: LuxR C-terminal-related transcriptional regulator [Gemmatimonadota bacterium]